MVFRYHLTQLFTRDWRAPANVTLKSPKLSFDDFSFPYGFFDNVGVGSGGSAAAVGVRLDGGEARFFIPKVNDDLVVKDINGTVRPLEKGNLRVDLRAVADGVVTGRMRIVGEVNPLERTHQLWLLLENVDASEPLSVPFHDFKGGIRWENDNFYFKNLSAKFHGWQTELNGQWLRMSSTPSLGLNCRVGKKKKSLVFDFLADLQSQDLKGSLQFLSQRHQFRGKITRNGMRFTATDMVFDETYRGNILFDGSTSDLSFQAEKERQRIGADLNLKDMNIRLRLKGDHVSLFGLDIVGSTIIRLAPIGITEKRFQWEFNGDFDTEYFIVQYLPLDDFHGHFEIGPSGIKNVSAFWGEVFRLEADLAFRKRPDQVRSTIYVDGFDLKNVKKFASKPLRKELGGMLTGKLRIQGGLDKPELFGNFSVKDGRIGKLNYERGLIRFQGVPPYVPLQDSRILRGRTTLYLTGALNFSILNIFKNVELQTADKIVIWKGWELNANPEEGDLELSQKFLKLPIFSVKTGAGSSEGSAEDEQKPSHEEQYVTFGPKLKF